MIKNKEKIICLMGPTASGKTKLASILSQKFPLDIISVDSAMVYKGMDIGTAKPTKEEQALAPHRLIDICDPAESYSAGQFCHDAEREIFNIHKNKRIPLLCGGTMLYFSLFQRGFSEFPSHDPFIRDKINQRANTLGWAELHKRLALIDPKAARKIHPNDPQRIQRAFELYEMTGQTMSDLQAQQVWRETPYEVINIILYPPDRVILHRLIEERIDKMLTNGLIEEVKKFFSRKDLNTSLPSMRMLNYRQVWAYLEGKYDLTEMRKRAIYATRQFAKRQYTWLKHWQDAKIFTIGDDIYSGIEKYLEEKLTF